MNEQIIKHLSGGCRNLVFRLQTTVAPEILWNVLTDYNHLSQFIPNLAFSNLLWRRNNTVGLRQVGSQKLLGLKFSAQVSLKIVEYPQEGRLDFCMLQGDFRHFEGFWQVEQSRALTILTYDLSVKGTIGMPIALIEQRLRNDINSNLKAISKEAQKRSSH